MEGTPLCQLTSFINVRKQRLRCSYRFCRKVFTQSIPGISKGARTTRRYKRALTWAAQTFISMKGVTKQYRCSARTAYQAVYEQLELYVKARQHELPKFIRLDEHFIRKPNYSATEFATIVVDQLKHHELAAVKKRLNHHPELHELWEYKQANSRLYRTKGFSRAKKAFKNLVDRMGHSSLAAARALPKTSLNWQIEILSFFKKRLSNGRTEGCNEVGKLIQRMSYGYRNFDHYRLNAFKRLLVRDFKEAPP